MSDSVCPFKLGVGGKAVKLNVRPEGTEQVKEVLIWLGNSAS
jgi:hypothetical protein